MSKTNVVRIFELTYNFAIKRLSKLEGKNKESLVNEFRDWINAIESEDKNYDVLYLMKIN